MCFCWKGPLGRALRSPGPQCPFCSRIQPGHALSSWLPTESGPFSVTVKDLDMYWKVATFRKAVPVCEVWRNDRAGAGEFLGVQTLQQDFWVVWKPQGAAARTGFLPAGGGRMELCLPAPRGWGGGHSEPWMVSRRILVG